MENVIKETKFYDDLCDKRHFHRISGIRYPAPAPAGGEPEFEYPAEANILQISDPDIGSGRPLHMR